MNYNFLILQKPKINHGNIKEKPWDKLYSLDKVKLNKFKQKRQNNEIKQLEDEKIHCTFSPKLNHAKSKSLLLELPMSERIVQYNKKKDLNLTFLQQNEFKKENDELIFSPKTLKNYKLEMNIAENVILSPNSYHNFVDRLKQMRKSHDHQIKKQVMRAGTGTNWKNQITVPQGPSFLERNTLNRSQSFNLNQKSNHELKDLNQTSFLNKNEIINKLYTAKKYMIPNKYDPDEKFKIKEKFGYENIFNFQKTVTRIDRPMIFKDAKKILHNELHENNDYY